MQLQHLASIVALLAIGASALPTATVDTPSKRAEAAPTSTEAPTEELWKFKNWEFEWDLPFKKSKHRRAEEVAPPTEELWKFKNWEFEWDLPFRKSKHRRTEEVPAE
ncbi:hypothetical protein OQA88_3200 [Cercophora sp. LCS_1]